MPQLSQLSNPTPEDIAQILTLFRLIPGRTCSAANYLEYLNIHWQNMAIFVARDDDGIIQGFTHAERPSLLEPKTGWLPFSYLSPAMGHKTAQDALRLAFRWMASYGATSARMTSVRSARALKKAHGWVPATERLYTKEITYVI